MLRTSLLVCLTLISLPLMAKEQGLADQWVMYSRNFHNPFLKESIVNFADKTKSKFGEYNIVSSGDMEQGRAFAELLKGNIDIFIGAPTLERENLASAIYVPIDRGLLGFRVCLIHKTSESFVGIASPEQFIENKLTIGVGTHWPDKPIYAHNGFTTITSPIHRTLYSMLNNKRFDCLSRSVNEVYPDIETYSMLNMKPEENLVFIYPLADFIFINVNKAQLHQRLSKGLQLAIEDMSFYDIFDKHYADDMRRNKIFERKLIFLRNNNISDAAMQAINEFGIASFLTETLADKNDDVDEK